MTVLLRLGDGVYKGMEDVADFADLVTLDIFDSSQCVSKKTNSGNLEPLSEETRENLNKRRIKREKITLEKFDARRRLWIEGRTRGREKEITVELITTIITSLLINGKAKDKINQTTVAQHVGCSASAITKTCGGNPGFKKLLEMCCAGVSNEKL